MKTNATIVKTKELKNAIFYSTELELKKNYSMNYGGIYSRAVTFRPDIRLVNAILENYESLKNNLRKKKNEINVKRILQLKKQIIKMENLLPSVKQKDDNNYTECRRIEKIIKQKI